MQSIQSATLLFAEVKEYPNTARGNFRYFSPRDEVLEEKETYVHHSISESDSDEGDEQNSDSDKEDNSKKTTVLIDEQNYDSDKEDNSKKTTISSPSHTPKKGTPINAVTPDRGARNKRKNEDVLNSYKTPTKGMCFADTICNFFNLLQTTNNINTLNKCTKVSLL